jgi:hypothetical protein
MVGLDRPGPIEGGWFLTARETGAQVNLKDGVTAATNDPKQIRKAIKLINQLEKVTLQKLETLRELRSALKAKLEQLGG